MKRLLSLFLILSFFKLEVAPLTSSDYLAPSTSVGQLFFKQVEGDYSLYFNPQFENENWTGGEYIQSFKSSFALSRTIKRLLQQYELKDGEKIVVANYYLSKKGELRAFKETLWSELKEKEGHPVTLVAEIVKGYPEVVGVYDSNGEKIYPFNSFKLYQGDRFISSFQNSGGLAQFIRSKIKQGVFTSHHSYRIENHQLSEDGRFKLFGFSLPSGVFDRGDGLIEKRVNVYFEVSQQQPVMTLIESNDGYEFYPKQKFVVYKEARIKDGKRIGGIKIEARFTSINGLAQKIETLVDEHGALVIEKFVLNKIGGLKFLGQLYWQSASSLKDKEVTVVVKKDEKLFVSAVYSESGEKIYPFNNYILSFQHEDELFSQGHLSSNTLNQALKKSLNSKVLKEGSVFSVKRFKLDSKGGLRFYKKQIWNQLIGYENSLVNIDVVIEDGEPRITSVQTLDQEKLYPVNDYVLYKGGHIDFNGKVAQSKKIGAERSSVSLMHKIYSLIRSSKFKEGESVYVENFVLDEGKLSFLGLREELISYSPQPISAEKVTLQIELKGGVPYINRIFSPEGELLYQVVDPEEERERAKAALTDETLSKMSSLFGVQGTLRLVRKMYSVSVKDLVSFYRKVKERKKAIKGRRLELSFKEKFQLLASMQLLINEFRREDFKFILTDEMIRIMYPYLVKDPRFLDEVKALLENEKNSIFKQCFKRAIQFYEDYHQGSYQGVHPSIQLKLYQKIAIALALKYKKFIFADKPGLGKTLTALIAALNIHQGKGARRVLIFSPKTSKQAVWEKQIVENLEGEQPYVVINSRHDLISGRLDEKVKKARFVIVNYGLFQLNTVEPNEVLKAEQFKEKLSQIGFDFIIYDEIHNWGNDKTQIYQAMESFSAEYEIGITGTLLRGNKIDRMRTILEKFKKDRFSSSRAFSEVVLNRPEVFRSATKDLLIRRYSEDVLPDLPQLSIIKLKVSLSEEERVLYEGVKKEIDFGRNKSSLGRYQVLIRAALDGSLVRRIELTDVRTGQVKVIPVQGYLSVKEKEYRYKHVYDDSGKIAKMIINLGGDQKKAIYPGEVFELNGESYTFLVQSKEVASSKFKKLDEVVEEVVSKKREKLTVFSGSSRAVYKLRNRYQRKGYQVYMVKRSHSVKRRAEIIEAYNQAEGPAIFIATYHLAGEAVDLSGSAYGVLLDRPWVAQIEDQVLRRLHRFGQNKPVTYFVLEAEDTIDQRIDQVIEIGNALEKVLFDDPGLDWNPDKELFGELKEKEKKPLSSENNPLHFNDVENIWCHFEEGDFKALLKNNSNESIAIKSFDSLIKSYSELDHPSRKLLRNFLIERLEYEVKHSVNPKHQLLWFLSSSLVPSFKHIDYDPEMNFLIKKATLIIYQMIKNTSFSFEKMNKESLKISKEELDKVLLFLKQYNLIKVFYTFGVFDQEGLKTHGLRPLKLYPSHSGYSYNDLIGIEEIAPQWEVFNADPQGKKGLQGAVDMVRELTEEEEQELAKSLVLGNRAAGLTLTHSSIRYIQPLVRRAGRSAERHFNVLLKGDWDDLNQEAVSFLMELVYRYAQNGVYKRLSFKAYLDEQKDSLRKKIVGIAYELVTQKLQERSISQIGSVDSPMQMSHFSDSSMLSFAGVVPQFRRVLLRLGFDRREAEIIVSTTLGEELINEDPMQVKVVLKRYFSVLESVGYERFKSMLIDDYPNERVEIPYFQELEVAL